MPYCSLADVQAWKPDTPLSGTSRPTDTTVTGWISDYTGKMNAAMVRGGVVLANLTADELLELKLLNAHIVCYEIAAALSNAEDKDMPALYLTWKEEFDAFIEKAETGLLVVGAATVDDTSLPDSFTRDADELDMTDSRNPIFTREYEP